MVKLPSRSLLNKGLLLGVVVLATVRGLWPYVISGKSPRLSPDEIGNLIQVGMTPQEVKAALGKPNSITASGWIYHNTPPEDSPTRIFVLFEDEEVSQILLRTPKRSRP